MFIGHFGVGFAAKKAAPCVSLGTLCLASLWLDLLWSTLLLLGVEQVEIAPSGSGGPPLVFRHYPISHGLVAALVWAILAGVLYFAVRRRTRGAAVVGVAVLSHWLLDFIVHKPDLPLLSDASGRVGLGLWDWPMTELAIEGAMFGVGVWLYTQATSPLDGIGRWAFVSLVGIMVTVHVANVFGPRPPGVESVAWAGQAQWLFVAWAYGVDRHRRSDAVADECDAATTRP